MFLLFYVISSSSSEAAETAAAIEADHINVKQWYVYLLVIINNVWLPRLIKKLGTAKKPEHISQTMFGSRL